MMPIWIISTKVYSDLDICYSRKWLVSNYNNIIIKFMSCDVNYYPLALWGCRGRIILGRTLQSWAEWPCLELLTCHHRWPSFSWAELQANQEGRDKMEFLRSLIDWKYYNVRMIVYACVRVCARVRVCENDSVSTCVHFAYTSGGSLLLGGGSSSIELLLRRAFLSSFTRFASGGGTLFMSDSLLVLLWGCSDPDVSAVWN